MINNKKLSYKDAGVDVDAGNQAVNQIKDIVKQTFRPEVLTELGGFGGTFALNIAKHKTPVLVSGTDGVGTKLKLAFACNKHDTVGIDLVAMCVNDILAQGAEPLFFLDYIATGKLNPNKVTDLVTGIAEGCKQAGCALVGGETAEMPGFYGKDEYDMAGFVVGVVDKENMLPNNQIADGHVLIGLASSGVHSNGFSLVRKVVFDVAELKVDSYVPELGKSIGEALLEPTRIYVKDILPLLERNLIDGLAHITGGGVTENTPRMLPNNLQANITKGSWPVLPIFNYLQQTGNIAEQEMYRTYNMGIGLVLAVNKNQVDTVLAELNKEKQQAYVIGNVSTGTLGVQYSE
ncbi:phosphoribosylformylglycinamidine cyclo-ligase [Clostridium sp. 'deep sea']|uniref:phosphoribosylformylglycinamidine cyclo-ligase n=1 Tax=Clostridium sp. 'deep sea' TaxID=2779445 RepID=UPI00189699A6|nr:phosphoribosylformylglycinamidine cyclo-ligase [Clostridium sp. 'deep sea']QOR34770.1 phosphoribosylformylglycinamidine cyclo-ligase [Clostridium sp. 'deep sea']